MKLTTIKESSSIASNRAADGSAGLTVVPTSDITADMLSKRSQMIKRLSSAPYLGGLHYLITSQIDFSSYKELMKSVARLRDNLHVAASVLSRILEFKRQNEILSSAKLAEFVTEFIMQEGLIAKRAITQTVEHNNRGERVRKTTFASRPLAYLAGISLLGDETTIPASREEGGAGNPIPRATEYNVDFITSLCLLPTSLLTEGQPTLLDDTASDGPLSGLIQTYSQAIRGFGLSGSDILTPENIPKLDVYFGEVQSVSLGLTPPSGDAEAKRREGYKSSEVFATLVNVMSSPARIRQVDHLICLLLDSKVINKLFKEQESKVIFAQNTYRLQTVEGIAAYLDYVLQYPIMYLMEAAKHGYEAVTNFTGMTWRGNDSVMANYRSFVEKVNHPIYAEDHKAVMKAINDPDSFALQPPPMVLPTESLTFLGLNHLVEALAGATEVGPEGKFTDMKELMKPAYRALIHPLGVSSHDFFDDARAPIITARRYETLQTMFTSEISIATFSALSPEARAKASDALSACPVPVAGRILLSPRPDIVSPIVMTDEAIGVTNTTRNTVAKAMLLQEEMAYSMMTNVSALNLLNHSDAIGFDRALAQDMAALLTTPWNSLYPIEIMDGNMEHIGDMSTLSTAAASSLIGGLIKQQGTTLRYAFQDPNTLQLAATAFSSFASLIMTDADPDEIKIKGWNAFKGENPSAKLNVVEGYGKPYGRKYADLFSTCTTFTDDMNEDGTLVNVSFSPEDELDQDGSRVVRGERNLLLDPNSSFKPKQYRHTMIALAETYNDPNTKIYMVPLIRIPAPTEVLDTHFVGGPIRRRVSVGVPHQDKYIPIRYTGSFVRDAAFMHLTSFHVGASAPLVLSYASPRYLHLTSAVIAGQGGNPEFVKEMGTGFKLPGKHPWEYQKSHPFEKYSWYEPFVIDMSGLNEAMQDAGGAAGTATELIAAMNLAKEKEAAAQAAAATAAIDEPANGTTLTDATKKKEKQKGDEGTGKSDDDGAEADGGKKEDEDK